VAWKTSFGLGRASQRTRPWPGGGRPPLRRSFTPCGRWTDEARFCRAALPVSFTGGWKGTAMATGVLERRVAAIGARLNVVGPHAGASRIDVGRGGAANSSTSASAPQPELVRTGVGRARPKHPFRSLPPAHRQPAAKRRLDALRPRPAAVREGNSPPSRSRHDRATRLGTA
jgi:hypothetical protein